MRTLATILLAASSLTLFLMAVSFYILPEAFGALRLLSLCAMVVSIGVLKFLGYPLYGTERRWTYSNSLVVCALVLFTLGFAKFGPVINGLVVVVLAVTFIGAAWKCMNMLTRSNMAD